MPYEITEGVYIHRVIIAYARTHTHTHTQTYIHTRVNTPCAHPQLPHIRINPRQMPYEIIHGVHIYRVPIAYASTHTHTHTHTRANTPCAHPQLSQIHTYFWQMPYEIIDGVHIHRVPIALDPDFITECRNMCNSFCWFLSESESFQGAKFDICHGHDWLAGVS